MMINVLLTFIMTLPILVAETVEDPLPTYLKVNNTVASSTLTELFKLCPTISEKHVMPETIYNPSPTHLVKFDSCLDIKELLVVGWHGRDSQLERAWAVVVALHYAAHMSQLSAKKYLIKHIGLKTGVENMSRSKAAAKPWFSFFKLYY